MSVCRSSNGTSCGTSWQQGWIVFVDTAATETAAPTVFEVLRVFPATTGDATVTTFANSVAADMQWVRCLPRGTVRTGLTMPVRYDIKVSGCTGTQGRSIELNTIGRTSVTATGC